MKKVAFLLLVLITVSSCSLFEKPSMTQDQIDSLVKAKAEVDENYANLQEQYDLLKLEAEQCARSMQEFANKTDEVKGNYFVIAGSFKNSSYADDYSTKIRNLGGDGSIIQGPYSFNLVAYSAHETLASAAESMYNVRSSVSAEAWVYKHN